jgi:hypothetical protein
MPGAPHIITEVFIPPRIRAFRCLLASDRLVVSMVGCVPEASVARLSGDRYQVGGVVNSS